MICLKIRIKELPDVGVQIEMTTTNKAPTQNEMGVAHVLNNVVRRAAKLEELGPPKNNFQKHKVTVDEMQVK